MALIDAGNGHALATAFLETTNLSQIFDAFGTGGGGSIGAFGPSGEQCLKQTGNNSHDRWNLGAQKATIRFSLGCYLLSSSSDSGIFGAWDNGTIQATIRHQSDGICRLTGTASTFAIPIGTKATVEGEVTIHNTAGAWVIRVNGVEVLNVTGINTRSGTGNNYATQVSVGYQGDGGGKDHRFTHFFVFENSGAKPNAFMGDGKFEWLQASGAGSSAQWTPSAGSNYACVDESPPSDADYIEDATVGHKDSYATADLATSVGAVHFLVRVSRARKTDAGAGAIRQNVKSGATEGNGADIALSTADVTYKTAFPQDPNAGPGDWTIAAVNAMEHGSEVRA